MVWRGVRLLGMGTGAVFLRHELLVCEMAASHRFLCLCHSHVHQPHDLPCSGKPFADGARRVVRSFSCDLADVDFDSNADLAWTVTDFPTPDCRAGWTIVWYHMSVTPLFSCVMPVKGSRPYMEEALASLHNQALGGDLEIIIQDGDVEPDAGQSDALNKGFAKAKGEWLFWLNADDVLLPGALQKVKEKVSCFKFQVSGEKGVDWIAGNTVYIDKDGKGLDARWNKRWHPFLYKHMPVWTGGPSAFFKRELWEKIGGLDTSLKYVMDIDLWTRMARAGAKYEVVDFPVWGFRWHEGSLTASGAHAVESAAEMRKLCGKFGYGNQTFWRMMMRATQMLDGSWARRMKETRKVERASGSMLEV